MKKLLIIFAVLLILLIMPGCGKEEDFSKPNEEVNNTSLNEEDLKQDVSTDDYFWDYRSLEKYADVVSTSAYDETNDRYTIESNSNVIQNALASLLNKYENTEEALQEYEIFYPHGGDEAAGLLKEYSFDEESPILFRKDNPIEMKFVAEHEVMINEVDSLIFDDEYLERIKDYTSESEMKKYKNVLSKMENDSIISSIREKYEQLDDATFEEIAYVGAKYADEFTYFKRPEDAHYEVKRVFIMNGDSTSKSSYSKNARVKSMKITVNDKEYKIDLEDTPECQIFDLGYKTNTIDKPVIINIELLEVFGESGQVSENDSAYLSALRFDIDQTVFSGGR
jgi:hypothetical protein